MYHQISSYFPQEMILIGLGSCDEHTQISFVEGKSMVFSTCIASIPVTMADLHMCTLIKSWNGWGQELTEIQQMVV